MIPWVTLLFSHWELLIQGYLGPLWALEIGSVLREAEALHFPQQIYLHLIYFPVRM